MRYYTPTFCGGGNRGININSVKDTKTEFIDTINFIDYTSKVTIAIGNLIYKMQNNGHSGND